VEEKMSEIKIGKDTYHETTLSDEVEVPGGLTLKVDGLKAHICHETGEILMDAATLTKRDQGVVAFLIRRYSNLELPGNRADFIRRLIHLKFSDWAELAKLDQSTLSRAVTKENYIDHYAALVLVSLAADFVTGGRAGRNFIESSQKVGSEISIPVKAVEVA
jgi:hypothetical protein